MSALPSMKSALRQLRGARASLRTAREYARSTRLDERVRQAIEDLTHSIVGLERLQGDLQVAETKRALETRKHGRAA